MLDECITKLCARAVIDYLLLLDPPVESHFLVTYLGQQGALDGDWSLLLRPPEDWFVVSSDAGRSGPRVHAKGPPLHLILPPRRISSLFIRGKSLNNASGAERAKAIIGVLPKAVRLATDAPPGSRYKMNRSGDGFALDLWPWRPPTRA